MTELPTPAPASLSPEELDDLRRARALLGSPSLLAKATDVLGMPLEAAASMLPDSWRAGIEKASESALEGAMGAALKTLHHRAGERSHERWHKLAAGIVGAAGGAGGLPGLALELPVSTVIMLRSIADIARSEGEDLDDANTKLACLEVFALGSGRPGEDKAESAYWGVRLGLADVLRRATGQLATHGLGGKGAPAVTKFLASVAARFNVVVTEKVAVQALPIVGAAGGALINTLFIDHFQDVARGHFILRRLERRHGRDAVRAAYERLAG